MTLPSSRVLKVQLNPGTSSLDRQSGGRSALFLTSSSYTESSPNGIRRRMGSHGSMLATLAAVNGESGEERWDKVEWNPVSSHGVIGKVKQQQNGEPPHFQIPE
eukprot:8337_1